MLAALCLTALGLAPQEAPAPRSLLEAVPPDALLAVVIEDVPGLWERARSGAWAALWLDPELTPVWELLESTFREGVEEEALTLRAFLSGLEGAVVYLNMDEDAVEPGFGFAFTLRPGQEQLFDALEADLADDAEAVEREGRTWYVDADEESGERFVGRRWSRGFALVGADDRERALTEASGFATALEGGRAGAGLGGRVARLRPAARESLEVYAHLGAFLEAVAREGDPQGRAVLDAIDASGLGWGSLHVTPGPGVALELASTLELPAGGILPRLAAHVRPAPLELARYAPADALEVSVVGYDVRGAWRSLRAFLREHHPGADETLAQGLEAAALSAGVDLEADLIEVLSGAFAEYLIRVPIPEGDGKAGFLQGMTLLMLGLSGVPGTSPGSVFLIGLDDPETVDLLVETLLGLGAESEHLGEEQVHGRWVQYVEIPDLEARASWVFLDDALAFSLWPEALRAVLAQAGEEAPPAWLDDEANRAALAAGGRAFDSSVADLPGLLNAKLAGPLAALGRMGVEMAGLDEASEDDPRRARWLQVLEALPGLVDRHLAGRAFATTSLEGPVLRWRVWTL